MMFSGHQPDCPSFRPLTPISRDAFCSHSGGLDFNEIFHKYSLCEWTLLKRLSRSKVKGQVNDQTECYNGGGMLSTACIAWMLTSIKYTIFKM